MSSKIEIQRICEYCKNEFIAKTTVTKYCSHKCNQRHYKAKVKEQKIKKSNSETTKVRVQPIEVLKAKEFLTVREVSQLLNCSVRTAYNYIDSGTIKAVNLGQRMIRVKRSEIDNLFKE
ncbi:helix-turn-helix domain-containing protein [Flavobacteriales bacterium]|nr:helix-turn-helix domain-containing protein [Flavobacteriales bacterium]MDB4088826.1 helix-turn-helix domain-containing protein [Flavobacteriales bacterium]